MVDDVSGGRPVAHHKRVSELRFGVELPQHMGYRATVEMALAAEELGYDSVWVRDHLIVSPYELTQFQHGYIDEGRRELGAHYLSCIPTMAAIAAVTSRVVIGSDILNLPRRNPVDVANEIATIDEISGGRVILHGAIGQPVRDWAASGVRTPLSQRGAMMAEALTIIKALWTQDEPYSFTGRYYDIDAARIGSRPVQEPHPPIWLGVERTFRRVARLADGFTLSGTMFGGEFEAYRSALGKIRVEAVQAGRSADEIEPAARFAFTMDDDVTAAKERGERDWGLLFGSSAPWHRDWAGDADTICRIMQPWIDEGVRHILLWPIPYASPAERLRDIGYFAERVIPRLR